MQEIISPSHLLTKFYLNMGQFTYQVCTLHQVQVLITHSWRFHRPALAGAHIFVAVDWNAYKMTISHGCGSKPKRGVHISK